MSIFGAGVLEYEVLGGATWRRITKKRDVDDVERDGLLFSSMEKVINGSAKDRHKLFVEAAVNAELIAKPASLSVPRLKASIIWHTSLREDSDFLRLLGCGLEDAYFVLIMALLPNLESLTIDGLSPCPLLDWHHFLSCSASALRNLTTLRIDSSITTPTEPVVMNNLQILDILPELESLQLFDIGAKGHKFTMDTLLSDNVKCFVFNNCGMSLRLLRKMLNNQQLVTFEYLPVRNRHKVGPAAELSATDMVALLAPSKPTLKKLALFPVDRDVRCSLKSLSNVEDLGIPHPGLLDLPSDARDDPATLATLLRDQLPDTLHTITLRYLRYKAYTKTVLEQLAQLKMQGFFPSLTRVRLLFWANTLTSYTIASPAGNLATTTAWHTLPDVTQQVHHDLDKLYTDAGIDVEIHQCEG
jgi:hypothetical protein